MSSARLVSSVVLFLALASGVRVADAQTVDTTLWAANGGLTGIVQVGGTLYIGGNFTSVGQAVGCGVRVNTTTGAAQFPFPRVSGPQGSGSVQVATPDGSGGWYISGIFTGVQGQPRSNLAHLDAGGNLTPWNPTADNYVRAIAVSGNTVYLGGDFKAVNGELRNNFAAVDATTGALLGWNPNATFQPYTNSTYAVTQLIVSGNLVYACGAFNAIGGVAHSGLVAIDALTGIATSWSPSVTFSPLPSVRAMVISGGNIYFGGQFTSVNGQLRSGVGAVDIASGAVTNWNPGSAGGNVLAMALSGSTLYVGGGFTSIGGVARPYLAALSTASGLATSWNPGTSGAVVALLVNGGSVYAGGSFGNAGGQPRNNAAAFDAATGALQSWDPNLSDIVWSLSQNGGTIFIGGRFTLMNIQLRRHLAALDAATGAALAWNPNVTTVIPGPPPYDRVNIRAMAAGGGYVYAAGDFTVINGVSRGGLAQLDPVTGVPTTWNPSPSGRTYALTVDGSAVYVGGSFTSIGGSSRSNLAAIDPATGIATAWNPGSNGSVFKLVVDGSTVYAGGAFTSAGAAPHNGIAAIDAATGAATAWDPNANSTVRAIVPSGERLYLGGDFTTMGGLAHSYLAAVDATTGAVADWTPSPGSAVYNLAVSGDRIYLSGYFSSVGGLDRKYIAAVNAYNGAPTSWYPNPDYYCTGALLVIGDRLYIGGGFNSIGYLPHSNLARTSIDDSPLVGVDKVPFTEGSAITLVEPNPSPRGIHVRYAVTRGGPLRIDVLDVAGRRVATLADGIRAPGLYDARWDGAGGRSSAAPGLYFIRCTAADRISVRRFVTLR